MKYTKPTSVAAAALLVCSALLSACGSETQPETKDTASVTTAPAATEPAETEDPRLPSSLPDTLDYAGETLNIWYFTKNSDAAEHFLDLKGDPEGDIVDNALYERNLAIEEQLNVKLNYVDPGIPSSDVGTSIRKDLMAGDATYDLYSVIQWNCSALALEHCFLNLSDAPHLDLDQPWWSRAYIDAMSIGQDNVFFLAGDISTDMIRCIASMYCNKKLFTDLYDGADVLYQQVIDGKWTFDQLETYVKDAYNDVNGNSQVDEGDRFGIISNGYNNIDALTFGMGTVLSRRDADNLPYLTIGETQNIDIYNRVYQLLYETPGGMVNAKDSSANDVVKEFINGNTMFIPGFLYTSEFLRDMKEDYAIIPFPKYDEDQENYISCTHDIATLMCLPVSCTKVDMTCAVLEAMAYYSYYNVTPVYYETALKTKYTRDDLSSQIIDIIHDTSMTDLAYVYSGSLNGAGLVMRFMIAEKQKDYVSYTAKREKSYNRSMEKFIEKFIESGE